MEDDHIEDLSDPSVTEKYREAANITNAALQYLIPMVRAGASIVALCEAGDAFITEACSKMFKSKGMDKGIAFPTCVSVNETVAHFSPMRTEDAVLASGDIVKLDLGAHFDGFIAVGAHTVVVDGEANAAALSDRVKDLITAAHVAAEVAVRTIKPGNTNAQVTEAVRQVCEAYGVTPLAGVLMHDMRRFVIDGAKTILLRGDDPEIKVEDCTFEPNEVYTVDIAVSLGEGKPRDADARTTVFKRSVESTYQMKSKSSRVVLNDIMKKFQFMPFTLRSVMPEDEAAARMGVLEPVKHGVLQPYPVLSEARGVAVAHVKLTVLLLPGGTLKVTGLAPPAYAQSARAIPAPIQEVLAQEPYVSKKKAKKAAAAAGGAGSA